MPLHFTLCFSSVNLKKDEVLLAKYLDKMFIILTSSFDKYICSRHQVYHCEEDEIPVFKKFIV